MTVLTMMVLRLHLRLSSISTRGKCFIGHLRCSEADTQIVAFELENGLETASSTPTPRTG
jgi:hypothetical protein